MLRSLFTATVLLFSSTAFAQEPTAAEIKAKKIKKEIVTNKYPGGTVMVNTYYYDAMGNDTANYNGGTRSYKVIKYNSKGNIDKILIYDNEGKEKEASTYTYKPDGSFTMVNKDAAFGLAYHYKYDKAGKVLEYKIPDGTVLKYTYNKGLLVKMENIPGDKEEKGSVTTYTYNTKNKIASSSLNGSANILQYEYGTDGLLKKISNKPGDYTSTYEYGY